MQHCEPALATVKPLSEEAEAHRRCVVVFVFDCGAHLKVPQQTTATAAVFFYRFFNDNR